MKDGHAAVTLDAEFSPSRKHLENGNMGVTELTASRRVYPGAHIPAPRWRGDKPRGSHMLSF